MSLRQQLQRNAATRLRDGALLQSLRSELKHELSSAPPAPSQTQIGSSVGGFTLEWDDPRTQDVVLRQQNGGSGEEIAVSALLAPLRFRGDVPLPRQTLMKVCLKKPGSDPVLHFDCSVEEEGDGPRCDFTIRSAYYYPSLASSGTLKHKAPRFRSLNPELQRALKEYLVDRGIGSELNNFLLRHLHNKEQAQYINWLQTFESLVAKSA